MRSDIAAAIAAVDRAISPTMLGATRALFEPYHEKAPYANVAISRDETYGSADRHRLDTFALDDGKHGKPVILFVHGGGFIRGEKSMPNSPYWDNVGLWAARNGYVGMTMSYRLAPAAAWPAGGEDIADALAWIAEHARDVGGDPGRIVLVGQSAGATHAATYVANLRGDKPDDGLTGVVLLSGIYDFELFPPDPQHQAYIGEDASLYGVRSPIGGLLETDVPLMFAVAEHDPDAFHAQGTRLFDALFSEYGRCPEFVYLPGHNHISEIAHLHAREADDGLLAARLADFIERTSARRAQTV